MTSGDMTASLRTGAAPPISLATVADAAVARICAAIAGDRVAIEPEFLAAHAVHSLYPPGTFYRRHRDSFRGDDARVLSGVLYLNDAWTAGDGGALRLYLGGGETRDVLPVAGTLICFLAPRYEHEVLPASRERLAVSGWFLRRA
jgi:Rps23 Pro-64 3,4-dihydroxylase Tpa1-like proline 4-hydroxylase